MKSGDRRQSKRHGACGGNIGAARPCAGEAPSWFIADSSCASIGEKREQEEKAKLAEQLRKQSDQYASQREELTALFLLMDIRRDPHQWEFDLAHWASHYGHVLIPVATKIDKLSASKRKPALSRIARALGVATPQVVNQTVSADALGTS